MSIKIEDLTVQFKGVTAVNHVNAHIPCGIYGLLGENGAGKTTLMRVLTTVIKPTTGSVTIDEMLYNTENEAKIRKQIGYLPQEIELYPNLTVRECLEYMGEISEIKKEELKKQIDFYLEKTSLTEHQLKEE